MHACLAYITGAFDMMSSLGNLSDKICVSGDVQLGQLKGVVEVWLRENPEHCSKSKLSKPELRREIVRKARYALKRAAVAT
jgi:hypothetical protein